MADARVSSLIWCASAVTGACPGPAAGCCALVCRCVPLTGHAASAGGRLRRAAVPSTGALSHSGACGLSELSLGPAPAVWAGAGCCCRRTASRCSRTCYTGHHTFAMDATASKKGCRPLLSSSLVVQLQQTACGQLVNGAHNPASPAAPGRSSAHCRQRQSSICSPSPAVTEDGTSSEAWFRLKHPKRQASQLRIKGRSYNKARLPRNFMRT